MRKFITFLIVMLIQIGIIYALYRWYVSYDSNSLNAKKEVTAEQTIQNNNNKNVDTSNPSEKHIAQNTKEQKDLSTIKKGANNNVSKEAGSPLIYKNAVWGDIPSLKEVKWPKQEFLLILTIEWYYGQNNVENLFQLPL